MAIYLQPLTYNEFIEENADALTAICSESGADRELDFDKERWCEAIYNDAHARGLSRGYPQLVFAKPRFAVKFEVALVKMRDGGKKMRCLDWPKYLDYLCVADECLIGYETDGKRHDLFDLSLGEEIITDLFLNAFFLMGLWVEVLQ